MEEKLKYWSKRCKLKELVICGYQGGYPMIQFKREEDMSVPHMSKYEINKVLRSAEMKGGVRLGVAFNLRRTAFLLVNEDTIVICGHEYVLDVILEKLFG